MNREQLVHDLSAAWVSRDHWQMAMEEAQAKRDEAQALAWELELKLFEPAPQPVRIQLRGFRKSISLRVLEAFATPKRVPEVVEELGLTRQQVQTAITRHVNRGRMVRRKRGVYVQEGV